MPAFWNSKRKFFRSQAGLQLVIACFLHGFSVCFPWLRPEVFDANVGVQLRGGKHWRKPNVMGCCVRHALINIKLSVKCMLKHGHKCSEPTSSKEMEAKVFMLDGAMGAKGTFRSTRGMLSQTKPRHFVQTFEDF